MATLVHDATASSEHGTTAQTRPWLACAVSVVVVLVQVALLDRVVGEEMLGITDTLFGRRFLRKEVLVAVLAAIAVLQVNVRRDLAAYRLAPLSPRRLAVQLVAFATLFGLLLAMAAGWPQQRFGDLPTAGIAAGLASLWIASLALLLPPRVRAAPLVAGAAFAAAVVAVGVALADAGGPLFWSLTHVTTTRLVEWLITPFAGAPVIHPEPNVLGTRDFAVTILWPCSGWQGILLITTLFAGYLWWFRRLHRFPQSLLLFPIGILLMYMTNVVRIAALILVGIWISPTIAVDGFHSQAGWVAFLVVGLGLIWAVGRIPFFLADPVGAVLPVGATGMADHATRRATARDDGAVFRPSVEACLLPFLALLVTTIATGLFTAYDQIDVLYPLRVLIVGLVLWGLRREVRWREASLSPVAVGLGALVFALWMLLVPTDADPDAVARQDPSRLGPLWGSLWLVLRVVGYTVTVPIAEELAFRGFLARRLVSADVERVPTGTFTWLSFLGSSLAFGAMHQANWIPATLAGLTFAAALYHRKRLLDAVVAHATTNALLSLYVIGTGSWTQWG